jgi:hypothetical protein
MSGPPNKLVAYDLSSYITRGDRANVISTAIGLFNSTYGLYPTIILLDSISNSVMLGAYS